MGPRSGRVCQGPGSGHGCVSRKSYCCLDLVRDTGFEVRSGVLRSEVQSYVCRSEVGPKTSGYVVWSGTSGSNILRGRNVTGSWVRPGVSWSEVTWVLGLYKVTWDPGLGVVI